MKIGLLGRMTSGKSTFARLLQDEHPEYEIYSFAGKLKEIVNDLFPGDAKNREILQTVGQFFRDISEDVWIDYLLKKIPSENVIIDDVRYENEIIALKKRGFLIIYLGVSRETQIERIEKRFKNPDDLLRVSHESERADDLKGMADLQLYSPDIDGTKQIIKTLR